MFCERCPHYRTKTVFRRKCFYAPQCPIGIVLKLVGAAITLVMTKARTRICDRRKEGR